MLRRAHTTSSSRYDGELVGMLTIDRVGDYLMRSGLLSRQPSRAQRVGTDGEVKL